MDTISHAIFYYRVCGYEFLEDVPWIVDEEISNITKPENKENFYVKDKVLVGSGEQSFLQLAFKGDLIPGAYVCATPCFRDEEEDDIHKKYFTKVEIFINSRVSETKLWAVINMCKKFFDSYIPTKIVKTDQGYDIFAGDYELGSYGIREYRGMKWIYGTGCAEPRLSQVVKKLKKDGYHKTVIPKHEPGTSLKIFEELFELKDAILSNTKILVINELTDIYGAIELFLGRNFGMEMDDLKSMNDLTRQAFVNGRR